MTENILNLFTNLRIQDIFDILIIWIMSTAVLIWFRERASRFVFLGIGVLGVVYLAARFFQLYLTTVVLQGFFAILLFVLVVIFQEDLRRFFEQLALWGRLRRKFIERQPVYPGAEIIAQVVSSLVRKRIGALIVLKGKDPLDRHLSRGIPLNGSLSQQLLESIFDPHSPGHDGAVVIEGGRVIQFGCHLPLSVNTKITGQLGLRHTAALGLSERSDSLCVVVSEERGTISIVRGEQLRELANAAALQTELEAFYAREAPKPKTRPIIQWLKQNPREKIIALTISCILWVAFGYQKELVRRDFMAPIEYLNVSSDWAFEKPKLNEVKVALIGPPQAFHLLNPQALKLSADLSQLREGANEITFTQDMVKRPWNLTVAEISPTRIGISASRMVRLSLPIQVTTEGRLPPGLSLQKISVTPTEVPVMISQKSFQQGMRIKTEPVDLKQLTTTTAVDVRLTAPPHVQFIGGKTPFARVAIKVKKSSG